MSTKSQALRRTPRAADHIAEQVVAYLIAGDQFFSDQHSGYKTFSALGITDKRGIRAKFRDEATGEFVEVDITFSLVDTEG